MLGESLERQGDTVWKLIMCIYGNCWTTLSNTYGKRVNVKIHDKTDGEFVRPLSVDVNADAKLLLTKITCLKRYHTDKKLKCAGTNFNLHTHNETQLSHSAEKRML
jgi:hypothetical protein